VNLNQSFASRTQALARSHIRAYAQARKQEGRRLAAEAIAKALKPLFEEVPDLDPDMLSGYVDQIRGPLWWAAPPGCALFAEGEKKDDAVPDTQK